VCTSGHGQLRLRAGGLEQEAERRGQETEKVMPTDSQLSSREWQVVELLTTGMSNRNIAIELHLSEGTIKEYINRIFKKLALPNRTALAVWGLLHMGGRADPLDW
jgi:DNA-binding NarL/FixJ family response regulator